MLGVRGASPTVYVGWSRDIEAAELSRWVADQDTGSMLSQLHELTVSPATLCSYRRGRRTRIGEGVFAAELQEPTDFSIMLEFKGFDIDPAGGDLGLGRDLAVSAVRRRAFSPSEISGLRRHAAAPGTSKDHVVQDVMPAAADPYFRAQRVFGRGAPRLEASFAVLLVIDGAGVLEGDTWIPRSSGGAPWWCHGQPAKSALRVNSSCCGACPRCRATQGPTTPPHKRGTAWEAEAPIAVWDEEHQRHHGDEQRGEHEESVPQRRYFVP